jgi:hypothetical protein
MLEIHSSRDQGEWVLTICRKDKTLTYILDTLKTLENKIDRALSQGTSYADSATMYSYPSAISQMRQQAMSIMSESSDPMSVGALATSESRDPKSSSGTSSLSGASLPQTDLFPYRHEIEARKILAWPAVRSLMQNDLQQIPDWDGESDGGEKWLTKISMAVESPLPMDEPVKFVFDSGVTPASWDAQTFCLTPAMIDELCQAFFRSFHSMYPILDARDFYAVILPQAHSCSFDRNDRCSVLVLLVLALGAVAQEGVSGNSIVEESTGRNTGMRGGTPLRPPGLVFLNEARKRIGVMITEYDIILLQCFILFS